MVPGDGLIPSLHFDIKRQPEQLIKPRSCHYSSIDGILDHLSLQPPSQRGISKCPPLLFTFLLNPLYVSSSSVQCNPIHGKLSYSSSPKQSKSSITTMKSDPIQPFAWIPIS